MKKIGETSYKETAFGIIPRSKLIPLEIEGTKKAWDFIIDKSKIGEISITVDFLLELHKIGYGWIFPDIAGRFRKIDVKVSEHIPPKFYQVREVMAGFTADLKIRSKHLPSTFDLKYINNLCELLAWAHHRFLWIHPFQDYNGRISRLLNNVILLNLNLPPIELKVETKVGRKKYIQALQKADNGGYHDLEKIIQSAIEESFEEVERTLTRP